MKKVIKNYLAKLQENDKKGFSLVELIIVMAIMAILVGIVASQVIPYMEKSRQSKDQQQLSSIATSLVSAIAQDSSWDQSVKGSSSSFSLDNLSSATTSAIQQTFLELEGWTDASGSVKPIASYTKQYYGASMTKCKSKQASKGTGIDVILAQDGKVTVHIKGATSDKMTVESE
jgi:prepilin-type N-terminal cleavage/methylation domain-containing protein